MKRFGLVTAVVMACAPGETDMTEQEALAYVYVRHLWHGIDAVDADTRARVRKSPTAMALYAGLVSGTRVSPRPVDTTMALWWLAESDDPAFVPIFLRYTEPHHHQFYRAWAIYGLARHAERADARARLLELTREPAREIRMHLAQALMHVNDTNAREILRHVSDEGLGPRTSGLIRRVLTAPARREKGRFPCLPNHRLMPGRGGAFECRPFRPRSAVSPP